MTALCFKAIKEDFFCFVCVQLWNFFRREMRKKRAFSTWECVEFNGFVKPCFWGGQTGWFELRRVLSRWIGSVFVGSGSRSGPHLFQIGSDNIKHFELWCSLWVKQYICLFSTFLWVLIGLSDMGKSQSCAVGRFEFEFEFKRSLDLPLAAFGAKCTVFKPVSHV